MGDNVKEIDLLVLFLRFFQFCKYRFWYIFIAGFLGGILGITVYFLYPQTYLYTISAESTEIPVDIIEKTINTSSKLFTKKIDSLSFSGLNIPNRITGRIKSLTAQKDNTEPQKIEIKLITTSPVSKKDVGTLLSDILNNNSYIKERIELRKSEYEKIISFIDGQIAANTVLPDKIAKDQGILVQGSETPTSLFLKRKQYEYSLNYLEPLVIDNFPMLPENPAPSIRIFSLVGGMLLIMVVLAYFAFLKLNSIANRVDSRNLEVINYGKSA
jgi:hypothetical protein